MDITIFNIIVSDITQLVKDIQELRAEVLEAVKEGESLIDVILKVIGSILKFVRLVTTERTVPTGLTLATLAIFMGGSAAAFFGRRAGAWFPVTGGTNSQALANAILATLLFMVVAANFFVLFASKNPSTRKTSLTLFFFVGTLIVLAGQVLLSYISQAVAVLIFTLVVVAGEATSRGGGYRRAMFWAGRVSVTFLALDFVYYIVSYRVHGQLVEVGVATRPPTLLEMILVSSLIFAVWYRYNKTLGKELKRL